MSYYVKMCCSFSHQGIKYESGQEVPDEVARIYPERCVRAGNMTARVEESYQARVEPEIVTTSWAPEPEPEADSEES